MKRFKHPFTLVELLCVIIVIALLAAISVKVTQVAYRRADETKTKTIMEIIRTALHTPCRILDVRNDVSTL